MNAVSDIIIYIGYEPPNQWCWRVRIHGRKVAGGGPFRTRKAALIQAVGWLLRTGWNPR